jgi:hypothetical protein
MDRYPESNRILGVCDAAINNWTTPKDHPAAHSAAELVVSIFTADDRPDTVVRCSPRDPVTLLYGVRVAEMASRFAATPTA